MAMERNNGGVINTCLPDNLIAHLFPPATTFMVDLKTTSAAIARGTVMSRESDGKVEVLGSGTGTANCVIAQDTIVGDTYAQAYRTGHFIRQALICADGYTLTAADEENLRTAGILLSDAAL